MPMKLKFYSKKAKVDEMIDVYSQQIRSVFELAVAVSNNTAR